MIKALKKKSEFGFNLFTLVSGTALAQVLSLAINPLLARFYAPQEFGLFTLYLSITAVCQIFATLRYEFAIVQPKKDEDAFALVVLSTTLCFFISFFMLCFVSIFKEGIASFLGSENLIGFIYLVPLSIFVYGCSESLNNWNSRKKDFSQIAKVKIIRSIGINFSQLGLKTILSKGGLIIGQIFGDFLSLLVLIKKNYKKYLSYLKDLNFSKITFNAKMYSNLAKYSIFGSLANAISLHLPIFILGKYFDTVIVGYFGLAWRVLSVPSSFLHRALSRVLMQKISVVRYDSIYKIYKITFLLFFILCVLIIPFTICVYFFGTEIFVFIFGETWRKAGSIASYLVLSVAIQFVVSPFSIVLGFSENVKILTIWQILNLLTLLLTFYFCYDKDIWTFLKYFISHVFFSYSIYFYLIISGIKNLAK